ncbi:MAG: prolipoprotein diacylglyceryl transferase [archaeon]
MINHVPMPVLFRTEFFTLYTWGAVFIVAFLVISFLFFREAKKEKVNEKHIWNILLLVLIGAIIGGRLFFIFEHFSYFIINPLEVFAFGNGGETSYGGFILSFLFVWIYLRKKKDLSFGKFVNMVAPYLPLGIAIGRIGCFLNWCCYGKASSLPWAVAVNGVAVHPTQIYLLIGNLLIFFILMDLKKKEFFKKPGNLFLMLLVLYSVVRFSVDFFRVYDLYFLGLALSQWILVLVFITSVVLLKLQKISPQPINRQ